MNQAQLITRIEELHRMNRSLIKANHRLLRRLRNRGIALGVAKDKHAALRRDFDHLESRFNKLTTYATAMEKLP